ncbi:tryptophan synthase subunit alpha [Providencia huaxiensis]|uniref:tryptophan synthase subunit alpha n=2 Tax=Providencia TaxID=586 RepID=UPI001F0489E2|nr:MULTISPECIES: tryptophan synthase subunit alpha [Providencia]MCG9944181.1 tryptophan synthase subunit alpha [Providencia rettgeri]WER20871.1 tryptophan synthase subunit alpha [Providencia stuartii]WER24991.1 tryptophan synthase subunit alpha [Providencia stuartii]WER29081.1 tryptophan synthase subunit alpha [Providencia stuartii]WOC00855.1 tryptophan synthase subunit alpha [Providencia sp. PROV046]
MMKITYRHEEGQDIIELAYTILEKDNLRYALESVTRKADVEIKTYGFIFKRTIITGQPDQIQIAGKALARRYSH